MMKLSFFKDIFNGLRNALTFFIGQLKKLVNTCALHNAIILPFNESSNQNDKILEIEENDLKNIQVISEHVGNVNNDKERPSMMLVIDDPGLRALIKDYFKSSYNVYDASSGLNGFEKVVEIKPDIIIADVMMPVMNGMEFCRKVKKDQRINHIPLIVLTAGDEHFYKEGLELGVDDVIDPFNFEILNARVSNLIKSRKELRDRFSKEVFLKPKDIAINNSDEQFLNKVIEIIEKNIATQNFSVDLLAREVCMSRSVLYRKLVSLTDLSINDLIKTIRLERAIQLLSINSLSINEISDLTGFSSSKYFSTCFKAKYEISPSDFRKGGGALLRSA